MFKIGFKILDTDLTRDYRKWADDRAKILRKALSLAVSKVAYKLFRDARQDLKTGKLGLRAKSKYRNKGIKIIKGQQVYMKLDKRYRQPRGRYKMSPLSNLFKGIIYDTNYKAFVSGAQKDSKWAVGFLGVNDAMPGQAWAYRIAEKSKSGYKWPYTAQEKMRLHSMGIHIRKTTTAAKVPPRDIMDKVRKKYPEHIMMQEIKTLFDRKMAGERI